MDEDFSEYFGFSGHEVAELLAAADRQDKSDVIKEWYDGYVFGDSFVYCPWDVINYVSALKKRKNARPKNYWKNTSIINTNYRYIPAQDKFSYARKLNEAMPVASSIEADVVDGNLDQRNVRLISVGCTRYHKCRMCGGRREKK